MTVTAITSLEQFKEIIARDKNCVVDFWATWCGPCRMISPVFEKMSELPELSHIDFYKVDVDEQAAISQECGIRAMPTFVAFKNGQKVNDLMGANPAGLQTLIKNLV
ncbi:hypothetical protein FRB94_001726 [Tulasnella sp. JGI-2019a]|nr:hypothetical protein FRB93_007218 [Tulasnella sp. JGI-2019a]KAG9013621.1 hypothetical protein FRB94_001726 [Tulasnella sp. JGI-2019a]KAG9035131.1 hypothetical protein FRB95_011998 [Tulasnella sp. JGI-2019a]